VKEKVCVRLPEVGTKSHPAQKKIGRQVMELPISNLKLESGGLGPGDFVYTIFPPHSTSTISSWKPNRPKLLVKQEEDQ